MKKNRRTNTNSFFVVLLLAMALVILIYTLFINYMGKITKDETERYLSELSASVVYSVDARLTSNLDALESIADSYVERKSYGLQDPHSLEIKAELLKFNHIYIVSFDGQGTGLDGSTYDFSKDHQIMAALTGERVITNNRFSYNSLQNGFAYAVPIYEQGQIIGAMVASNTTEWIINLLSQNYFDGKGFFHIIDTSGEFIVKSNNPYSKIKGNNFFTAMGEETHEMDRSSLDTLEAELAKGNGGSLYYALDVDQVDKIGKLFPLQHEGFTLVLVVTEAAASSQFNHLQTIGIQSNILIALALASILVIMSIIFSRHQKKLSVLAFVDPVTGGYSQTKFEIEAMKRIRSSYKDTYSFVSINIVKFKLINDVFGSNDGNRVLQHIYQMIQENLQEEELVCRTFADHFDVLLVADTQEALLDKLELISKQINYFNEGSISKYYLNLSVGVYQISDSSLSITSIRDRANVARKDHRITFDRRFLSCVFYSELERQKQHREKEMENRMVDALEHDEFVVYLQPKLSVEDNRIVGAEALVRWQDSIYGLIQPDAFIPFFEKNAFIIPLDLYVFEQTCQLIRKWIDAGQKPIAISVNLSRVHLKDPHFLDAYVEIQQRYAIPPSLLEIELTETALFEDLEAVVAAIDEIHHAGFYCSLDDFGSGYSSLNMLQDIHVDFLKLDRAFFRSPDLSDPSEKAIIESVVRMAEKLSMTIVSEGIETQEQLTFLRKIKCGMAQGYAISRPIPMAEFEKLLFGDSISTAKNGCDD